MTWKRGLITAVVALSTLGLAACASHGGGTKVAASCKTTTKISIATTPYQDSLLMSLGTKLGWYSKACLNVSFTNVDFSNTMSTLTAGTTDVAWYNTTGLVSTYHRKNDLVYLYPWDIFDEGAAMMARPSANLTTYDGFAKQGKSQEQAIAAVIDELHGKTVVTTLGTDTGEDLIMALRRQNKPQNWVKIVNLSQDQGLSVFLRGTGDVYLGGIPQRATLSAKKYDTLLAGAKLTPPPLNGYVTTKAFWQKNQDAMLALQHITFDAVRYTEKNLDAVAKYISSEFNSQTGGKLTAADFKSFFQHYEHYPVNAADAQKTLFAHSGYGYWNNIWTQDNDYLYTVTNAIPAKVPTSAFLGEQFQAKYVKKYGANETGWDKVAGSLN